MNAKLLDFHKKCTGEFHELLKEFNILFYGYGCKQALLKEIFPDAHLFNMENMTLKEVLEELNAIRVCKKHADSLYTLNMLLEKANKKIILALINFDFSISDLASLRNIKIVATVEKVGLDITIREVLCENFIFRDLTTFVPYTEETLVMSIAKNKVEDVVAVARHMPQKALLLFIELLKLKECTVEHLFKTSMHKLMITKKQVIKELLNEFIDHKIVKIKEGNVLSVNLNKDQLQKLLACELLSALQATGN